MIYAKLLAELLSGLLETRFSRFYVCKDNKNVIKKGEKAAKNPVVDFDFSFLWIGWLVHDSLWSGNGFPCAGYGLNPSEKSHWKTILGLINMEWI